MIGALLRAGFLFVDEVIHILRTEGDPALLCIDGISKVGIRTLRKAVRGMSPRLYDARLTHDIITTYGTRFETGYRIRDLSIHHINRFEGGGRGGVFRANLYDPVGAGHIEVIFFGDELDFVEREKDDEKR